MDNEMRLFLAQLAVDAYNAQRKPKVKFNYTDFDVVSITPNNNSKFAFELNTIRTDDYFRLRLYCNLSSIIKIGTYRLYDQAGHGTGLGDEIWVSDSLLNNDFLVFHNNLVRQSQTVIKSDESLLNVLLCEDGANAIVPGDDLTDFLDLDP